VVAGSKYYLNKNKDKRKKIASIVNETKERHFDDDMMKEIKEEE